MRDDATKGGDRSVAFGNKILALCEQHTRAGGLEADVLTGQCHAFALSVARAAGTSARIGSSLAIACDQLCALVPLHFHGGRFRPALPTTPVQGRVGPAPRDIVTTPSMLTMSDGLYVQRVEQELAPPDIGPRGGVSVGASHIPNIGPVLNIAIHDPHGETLVLTLGNAAFNALTAVLNSELEKIEAGDFNCPPVLQ